MDTSLTTLDPLFYPHACALLAHCLEARIPVVIVNTRRTAKEQQEALARGVSWVQHSRHQDGLAIDICPYEVYELHGRNKLAWSATQPVWHVLGDIGERLGLRWGGRWHPPDLGHFELPPVSTPSPIPV